MSQTKGEHVVQNWRENVKQVKTMSALHTLLGILENSVKWDKSAENAVSLVNFVNKSSVLRSLITIRFLDDLRVGFLMTDVTRRMRNDQEPFAFDCYIKHTTLKS